MKHSFRLLLLFALSLLALTAVEAWAQPVATLRFQLTPYCNVVTLNVGAQGAIFTLDGFDDQCGAAQRASVVGTAFLNPDGSVGIGLSTVLAPGGTFVHVDARIDLTSLNGTWRDSAGNSGTFVFSPGAGAGGPLRPVQSNGIGAGSITSLQVAPGAIGTGQVDTNQLQVRVSGSCEPGQHIRVVNANGTVVCETAPISTGIYDFPGINFATSGFGTFQVPVTADVANRSIWSVQLFHAGVERNYLVPGPGYAGTTNYRVSVSPGENSTSIYIDKSGPGESYAAVRIIRASP